MKLLPDTHLLIWAAVGDDRLRLRAVEMIEADGADLLFSAANLREPTI